MGHALGHAHVLQMTTVVSQFEACFERILLERSS